MARVIEYDVTGVEESSGGTGVKVKPGVYPAKIMKCEAREKKRDNTPANDIEVALSVGDEYDWLFTYVGLYESVDWKLAEFIRALGLKDKGKLNPERYIGKIIRVKVNPGSYNDEYRPEVGRLMKAQPGDEELIGKSVSEISSRNGDAPDSDAEADVPNDDAVGDKVYANPEFVASREGDEGVGSYEDWPEADLVAECEDRGLTLAGGRGKKSDKAIAALRAEDAEVSGADAGDDADEPPDDQAQAEAAPGDYGDWDLERLKTEWTDRNLGELPTARGRGWEEKVKAEIIEELTKDDADNPFTA